MARALAVNATASPTNPILDLWTLAAGQLVDVASVTWQILDVTASPPTVVASGALNVSGADHLGLGHYAATWTGAGTPGRRQIVWTVGFVGGPTQVYRADFDLLAANLSMKGPCYALLSDVRAEGWSSTVIADARALLMLRKVSIMIERWTRRFFEPRYLRTTFDGARGITQSFTDAIISIDAVTIEDDSTVVDPTSYRVFNRHIADGLTHPDDRDNPRITFARTVRAIVQVDSRDRPFRSRDVFWPGARNIAVSGLFGYTDPDTDVQAGATPELIRHACLLLFAREIPLISDGDTRQDIANSVNVTSIRTRDQSVNYGPNRGNLVTAGLMEFTGDFAIDDIIAGYCAPPYIGSP